MKKVATSGTCTHPRCTLHAGHRGTHWDSMAGELVPDLLARVQAAHRCPDPCERTECECCTDEGEDDGPKLCSECDTELDDSGHCERCEDGSCDTCGGSGGGPEHWRCGACNGSGRKSWRTVNRDAEAEDRAERRREWEQDR